MRKQQYHDWLLGEDSALRAFLPASLSAVSPAADAPALVLPSPEPEHLIQGVYDGFV